MYEPKTIDQAIRPMLLMNLIAGMGVFKNSSSRLFKCFEFIYTGIYMLFLSFGCYYTTVFFNSSDWTADYFLNRELFETSYFINGLTTTAMIAVARINAKKIRRVIALFDEYDRTMEKIGLPKHYHSIYWFQLYSFAFGTLMISISVIISFALFDSSLQEFIAVLPFTLPFSVMNVCNISFCVWIRYLMLKFEQLNDLLNSIRTKKSNMLQEKKIVSMHYDCDNKVFSPFDHEDIRRNKGIAITISTVKRSHLELTKIANVTSATYELQLLLLMCTMYIFLTSLFYGCYRIIWLNSEIEEILKQISVAVCLIILLVFELFITSHTCGKANTEAVVTGELICKLYGSYSCKIFRAEVRNFTLQLVQNPLTFTVYGFFTVDYSFLLRVIQSISTYLVILIQVGDSVIQSVRTLSNKNQTIATQSP